MSPKFRQLIVFFIVACGLGWLAIPVDASVRAERPAVVSLR
jgi:hypothetical protein